MNQMKVIFAAALISLSAPVMAQSDTGSNAMGSGMDMNHASTMGAGNAMDMMHSKPMDGAMVMEPTDRLEMMFDTDVRLMNVRVMDSSNKPVSIGFKPKEGHAMNYSVAVPTLKPDNYTVHWTAMGADGHRMSGSFQFMQH